MTDTVTSFMGIMFMVLGILDMKAALTSPRSKNYRSFFLTCMGAVVYSIAGIILIVLGVKL